MAHTNQEEISPIPASMIQHNVHQGVTRMLTPIHHLPMGNRQLDRGLIPRILNIHRNSHSTHHNNHNSIHHNNHRIPMGTRMPIRRLRSHTLQVSMYPLLNNLLRGVYLLGFLY
jgi:hypothetical protein